MSIIKWNEKQWCTMHTVAARGFLPPGANVYVAAPLVRSAAKSSPIPFEVPGGPN